MLANVATTNCWLAPTGNGTFTVHVRLPLFVVQPGVVGVRATTMGLPVAAANDSEFVPGDTYCARRADVTVDGGAGMTICTCAFAVPPDAPPVTGGFTLPAGSDAEPPPPPEHPAARNTRATNESRRIMKFLITESSRVRW